MLIHCCIKKSGNTVCAKKMCCIYLCPKPCCFAHIWASSTSMFAVQQKAQRRADLLNHQYQPIHEIKGICCVSRESYMFDLNQHPHNAPVFQQQKHNTPHASTFVFVLCIWTPLQSNWDKNTENHSNLEESSLWKRVVSWSLKVKPTIHVLKSAPRIKLTISDMTF